VEMALPTLAVLVRRAGEVVAAMVEVQQPHKQEEPQVQALALAEMAA